MSSLVRKSTERDGAGKICPQRKLNGPLYSVMCKNDIKVSVLLSGTLFSRINY
jgi:hypothetical protein